MWRKFILTLLCFVCCSLAGVPGPLITISSSSNNTYTLGWLGTTENSIAYEYLMDLPSDIQIANPGHIITIRNDTALLFPSFSSGTTQIFACSWKNLRCTAGNQISQISINSMSFDDSNNQLWFVGYSQSQNQYLVGKVVLNSFDQQTPLSPTFLYSFGNSSTANIQGALGPLHYYVSYTDEDTNYGFTFNRSTNTFSRITFQNGFAPVAMIYNANSLTNLTSLYESSTNFYRTCSPDFTQGDAEYPLNAYTFANASPSPLAAAEVGGLANYYYTILKANASGNLYVWVVNAADGWTISNNTISSTPLASSTIWGIATSQLLDP